MVKIERIGAQTRIQQGPGPANVPETDLSALNRGAGAVADLARNQFAEAERRNREQQAAADAATASRVLTEANMAADRELQEQADRLQDNEIDTFPDKFIERQQEQQDKILRDPSLTDEARSRIELGLNQIRDGSYRAALNVKHVRRLGRTVNDTELSISAIETGLIYHPERLDTELAKAQSILDAVSPALNPEARAHYQNRVRTLGAYAVEGLIENDETVRKVLGELEAGQWAGRVPDADRLIQLTNKARSRVAQMDSAAASSQDAYRIYQAGIVDDGIRNARLGRAPSDEALGAAAAIAVDPNATATQRAKLYEFEDAREIARIVQPFALLPPVKFEQAYRDLEQRVLSAKGATRDETIILDSARQQHARIQADVRANGLPAYLAATGQPSRDFNPADRSSMAFFAQKAAEASAFLGGIPVSMVPPAETQQMMNAINTAPLPDALRQVEAVAAMGSGQAEALATAAAQSGNAFAAVLLGQFVGVTDQAEMRTTRARAAEMLDGYRKMKELRISDSMLTSHMDNAYVEALGGVSIGRADSNIAMHRAALALHIGRLYNTGKLNGTTDNAIEWNGYQEALAEVVGGAPIKIHGRHMLPPVKDMKASDLESVLYSMTDRDMRRFIYTEDGSGGAPQPIIAAPYNIDGSTLTADQIRKHAQFRYHGDGTYFLSVGGSDIMGRSGHRYVIDLKGLTEYKVGAAGTPGASRAQRNPAQRTIRANSPPASLPPARVPN